MWKEWHTCCFVLHLITFARGLRLTRLGVPASLPAGHDARLLCEFDPEGDAVYSVRWFHNGREFYRFAPAEDPSVLLFPAPGLRPDARASVNASVVLRSVGAGSAGLFRCEVVAEAPAFRTVSREALLRVGEFYNAAIQHAYGPSVTVLVGVTCVLFYHAK